MTHLFIKQLLTHFNCNSAADDATVTQLETESGMSLPDEYKGFLQYANGGEGLIGKQAYVILWPAQKLIQMNKAYCVTDFAPGLFLFASDGGGEGYAFDTRVDSKPIVAVPLVGMNLKAIHPMAQTFSSWLEKLFDS